MMSVGRVVLLAVVVVALAGSVEGAHHPKKHRFEENLTFNCSEAPETPGDRRSNKDVLRIAHWNVEWLFLERWDKRWSSYEEAEKHLEDVAGVLKSIDADVVSLAEVEDCYVLQRLVEQMGDDTYRFYMVRGTDTSTGQNVALLTRVDPVEDLWRTADRVEYPVAGSQCEAGGSRRRHSSSRSSTYGVSKHFFTSIEPEGFGKLFLAGTHLLAFPTEAERCIKREAQAKVLSGVLEEALTDEEFAGVVAFGDMNDFDGSVPDVADSRPISRVLEFLKDSVEETAGDELINVAERVPQTDRYTAYYNPDKAVCKKAEDSSTSIDHMLLDPRLLNASDLVRFDNSLFLPPCAKEGVFSDHWPIVVQLMKQSAGVAA